MSIKTLCIAYPFEMLHQTLPGNTAHCGARETFSIYDNAHHKSLIIDYLLKARKHSLGCTQFKNPAR